MEGGEDEWGTLRLNIGIVTLDKLLAKCIVFLKLGIVV